MLDFLNPPVTNNYEVILSFFIALLINSSEISFSFLFSKRSFERIATALYKLSIEATSLTLNNFSGILLTMSFSVSVKIARVEFLKVKGLSLWSAFNSWCQMLH